MKDGKKYILIADDEREIREVLQLLLAGECYAVCMAEDGEQVLSLASEEIDLYLLDVNMPDMDGFTVVEKIRARGDRTPIVIVSGRKEDFDTLYALDIGADDYITKPFNPVTLGAKIKAILRRTRASRPGAEQNIIAGPFTYNTTTLRLYKNGTEIPLSAKENAIIKLFVDNVNHIFSKDMIYELVWGETVIDDNAIMVYINRLRQKIEDNPSQPKYIQTVRGIGYRFRVE